MKNLLVILIGLALTGNAFTQDKTVQAILEKYNRIRPNAEALAIYQLDWEDTLKTAQTRANLEGRPILLVIIHARYGDLHSGHC